MGSLLPIIISSTIAGIFSAAGLIISVLLKAKVEAYKKEVDGLKTELVAAVKGRGEAEGNIKGRIEQTQELKDAGEIKAESIIVTTEQASVNAANVVVEHHKEPDKK